jgi:hypothetical protein
MKLIELNINKILLLDDFKFKDPYNNIDYINQQALLNNAPEEQLILLKLASTKIEKFHSFYHFEQSYFHLQLTQHLLKEGKTEEANEQLKLCLFQDPLNKQAKSILTPTKEKISPYKRIYDNFSDYLSFASDEKGKYSGIKGYWQDYLDYKKNKQANILETIINKVRNHHLSYHEETSKLYINRAIIHHNLKHIDLAKNDLRKANYLDKNLKEKEYYSEVEYINTN